MPTTDSALDGLRVIDLAHPYGQYAGKLLADMGADVIKIEPPEGDAGRRIRPFKDGTSLFWVYYSSGKRVVALDLAKPEGQDELRRLIAGANAIIHTPEHNPLPGLELSYESLRELNPNIVVAAISGFREGGPYSGYRSTPAVAFALSGIMKTIGPPEGPPEAAPGQVAFDLTAVDAATGILCAILSGQGQDISVAAHELLASEVNPRAPEQFEDVRHPHSSNPQLAPSGAYPCKDGLVTFFTNLPNHWEGVKELLGNPPEIAGPEWNDRPYRGQHAKFLDELMIRRLADRTQ